MSPEQAAGLPATQASDVFSLGLILYEMLTGRKAIQAPNVLEALRQVEVVEPDRYAADVSGPPASILRQALVNDPQRRRITMAQIAALLE
jgi:serine/threonine-protein kinase